MNLLKSIFDFLKGLFLILSHPVIVLNDVFFYFKDRGWNKIKVGYCNCYVARPDCPFGSGKTLGMIERLHCIYKKNGKIYKGKPNKVTIFSNVNLIDIPYIPLSKDCYIYEPNVEYNEVLIYVIDEIGIQYNSRQYKNNFSEELLERLLTCRHHNALFLSTAQSFDMVDANFRRLTTDVTFCSKFYRVFNQITLSAQECCKDGFDFWSPDNKIVKSYMYFATNEIFGHYDTKAKFKKF